MGAATALPRRGCRNRVCHDRPSQLATSEGHRGRGCGDIDGADAQTLLAEAGLATPRPATESDIETIEYVAVGDMIYVLTDEAEELRRLTAGCERHRP